MVAQLLENYLSEWADRRTGPLMGGLLRAMNQVSKSSFDRGAQPALGIALATNYESLSLQMKAEAPRLAIGCSDVSIGSVAVKKSRLQASATRVLVRSDHVGGRHFMHGAPTLQSCTRPKPCLPRILSDF